MSIMDFSQATKSWLKLWGIKNERSKCLEKYREKIIEF